MSSTDRCIRLFVIPFVDGEALLIKLVGGELDLSDVELAGEAVNEL